VAARQCAGLPGADWRPIRRHPGTAAALLGSGIGLEGLRDSPALTVRHREAIASRWDRLLAWRDIIRLNDTLPLAGTAAGGTATAPLPRAAEILDRLGLW